MRPAKPFVAFALAIVLVAAVAGRADGTTVTTMLRLDGERFDPELALTSTSRARGLMHRRRAPADGMLFVFGDDTSGGFWMKNTLVPLRILFFDARGARVRALRMTPCGSGACPIYNPRKAYRFALELRATDQRPGRRLGPLQELRRLSRLAS